MVNIADFFFEFVFVLNAVKLHDESSRVVWENPHVLESLEARVDRTAGVSLLELVSADASADSCTGAAQGIPD